MDTNEKIRLLKSSIRSTLTLFRGDEPREEFMALILKVQGEGDDALVTFMDVMEGVERSLGVSEITEIKQ